jgi:hypothetical protein
MADSGLAKGIVSILAEHGFMDEKRVVYTSGKSLVYANTLYFAGEESYSPPFFRWLLTLLAGSDC